MNQSDQTFNKYIYFDDSVKQILNDLIEQAHPERASFNITDLNAPTFINARIITTTEADNDTIRLHYNNGAYVTIFISDYINHKDDIISHDISYVLREYGLDLDLTAYLHYLEKNIF